jgi:hypothetical protein
MPAMAGIKPAPQANRGVRHPAYIEQNFQTAIVFGFDRSTNPGIALRRIFSFNFPMRFPWLLVCSLVPALSLTAADAAPRPPFVLSSETSTAIICVESSTDPAVARAANDLAADIERVTERAPAVVRNTANLKGDIVIAGVADRSPFIDELVARGKIDVSVLRGKWETFLIQVVESPTPEISRALVILGSDRRGAIYGLYEISAQIGISPWCWWADVAPVRQTRLTISGDTRRFGPPSVKYRGIFINDEDWGLQQWAAKAFEPEHGGIGPKTYAKVFELLLRLKANTLWPAMHPGTPPFNAFPENARLADEYGIVMGSSHAEPMLRNNVGEWPHERAADYNYVTNRDGVLRYWEQRMAENGRYENIYTLGMRGIHDSNIQGPKTDAERIQTLEQIFQDQRALISRYAEAESSGRSSGFTPDAVSERKASGVKPDLRGEAPQMFCAYKEVLDLYRQGLRVPDDVTIVWPDDNFGYIRNFAAPAERARSGGFGVYYHLSYLGQPLSYLWLSTTPPALVWEEMHKAYEHGADRIWIANVGDIKPAEIPTSFFLEMAWDIQRWRSDNLAEFLPDWLSRTFGPAHARDIAALLNKYYLLNFQRKPEHLQWWLPKEPRRSSPLTDEEVAQRLAAFTDLQQRAEALQTKIPAELRDAYYELVYYPILAAKLANERFFEGERGGSETARNADVRLETETRFLNENVAGGKWRHMTTLEPADQQWSSMRIQRWTPPARARANVPPPAPQTYRAADASDFVANQPRGNFKWTPVPGLGRTGSAMAVLPTTLPPIPLTEAATRAPRLDYAFSFPQTGTFTLQACLLPTHPITGHFLRLAVALDDTAPQLLSLDVDDAGPAWAQGVLNAARIASMPLNVPTRGPHTLHVYAIDPGIVLDKLVIDLGGMNPSYLGPPPVR